MRTKAIYTIGYPGVSEPIAAFDDYDEAAVMARRVFSEDPASRIKAVPFYGCLPADDFEKASVKVSGPVCEPQEAGDGR
ncbi:hypothetical protein [Adlercreutzia equolifaciens]|uniref:hypothetical protein n=1 Tax=Adlercreutzia equolifaciens TaxID=446660 RepID=UPI0003897532|nr:hypothetical protein [Adlercreutzia equolifaciens]RFT84699.1 hypothetical protein DX903_05800 [Adlercreutzia equolifaciens]BAN77159.1 hypothetical protein AEQU_1190 [Adlercreutzia equolifaciens DSM 19450]